MTRPALVVGSAHGSSPGRRSRQRGAAPQGGAWPRAVSRFYARHPLSIFRPLDIARAAGVTLAAFVLPDYTRISLMELAFVAHNRGSVQ